MQWIVQQFDDTLPLVRTLDRMGISYSLHRVVPFVGELLPEPHVADPNAVVLFGSYALRHAAAPHGWRPGVFTIPSFLHEPAWRAHLLNGRDAMFADLRDLPDLLGGRSDAFFVRPVEDGKEIAGRVIDASAIVAMAEKVLALSESDIPEGSLRHDTPMMLSPPARITKEWRVWVVGGRVVAHSLYKEGAQVVYRCEIDDDALALARELAAAAPVYSPAYVMDICRTAEGLHLLETNCINAAGFYAADLTRLVTAIEGLPGRSGTAAASQGWG